MDNSSVNLPGNVRWPSLDATEREATGMQSELPDTPRVEAGTASGDAVRIHRIQASVVPVSIESKVAADLKEFRENVEGWCVLHCPSDQAELKIYLSAMLKQIPTNSRVPLLKLALFTNAALQGIVKNDSDADQKLAELKRAHTELAHAMQQLSP